MDRSSPELAALRARVEAYAFDRPGETIDFTARLRKQTGWSRRRAARAIAEYRRFAVLTVAAGHVVSPSHDVDEVWHLHLTETRRYWDEFCGEVLRRPLHHEPSRGGAEEDALYHDLYQRTLESYERLFGESPPHDVWPRPRLSLASRVRGVVARVRSRAGFYGVPALLFVAGCAVVDSSQPGSIQGPQFILGYLALIVLGLLVLAVWQSAILRDTGLGALSASSHGSYELAWLAGGKQRVLATVLLQLAQKGSITFDRKGAKAVQAAPPPADAPPLEAAVYDSVASGKYVGGPRVRTALDQLQARLEQAGLLPTKAKRGEAARAAWLIVGPMLTFGLVRLGFGVSHHKPSAFLFLALIGLSFVTLVMTSVRSRRTARGKRALAEAQAATPRATGLKEGDAALLRNLALFGAAVIAADAFGGYRRFVAVSFAGGDGGTSSSSCGGGGGGCGGGCGG